MNGRSIFCSHGFRLPFLQPSLGNEFSFFSGQSPPFASKAHNLIDSHFHYTHPEPLLCLPAGGEPGKANSLLPPTERGSDGLLKDMETETALWWSWRHEGKGQINKCLSSVGEKKTTDGKVCEMLRFCEWFEVIRIVRPDKFCENPDAAEKDPARGLILVTRRDSLFSFSAHTPLDVHRPGTFPLSITPSPSLRTMCVMLGESDFSIHLTSQSVCM